MAQSNNSRPNTTQFRINKPFSRLLFLMMTLQKSVLLLIFASQVFCGVFDPEWAVVEAINQMMQIYFVKNSPKVDLIHFGKNEKIQKIIKALMRNRKEQISFKVIDGNCFGFKKVLLNSSSILLFESSKNFTKFFKLITWKDDYNNELKNHLVHFPKGLDTDLDFIKTYFPTVTNNTNITNGFAMDQVNFLINVNQTSIDLTTSFMFTPQSCRSITFKVINTFDMSTMQWNRTENKNFYPRKTRHLHGCEFAIKNEEKKLHEDFLFNKLVNTFISISGGSLVISWRNADMYSQYFYTFEPKRFPSKTKLSFPILYDNWVFLVPPEEEFSQVEKILLPFEYEIWIAIVSTLLLALVVAELINQTSNKVRNFVFGVKSPAIVLVSIFLAGRQSKTPKRNFARFCLLLFIIWSLIIRTYYQSMLYKNFKFEIRKHELQNVFKAVDRNFLFCLNHNRWHSSKFRVYRDEK